MKKLSSRTHHLVQSDIRAVTRMINEAGGINLGQGICDLPTPDAIKEGAHRAIDENRSIYTHMAGIASLREAILHKAQTFNQLPASGIEHVMVSAGSTGAFVSTIFALLDPGDEIIIFEPYYGYHRNLLRLTGAVPRFVRLAPADWKIDFGHLKSMITPSTKAVLINTPGNPCGKVWTREELGALLTLAQEHDLYVITDEIYEYMVYDNRDHVSFASLPGAFERTITLSGFSKTFNMTGWRLGYAVGPEPLIEKMSLLNDLFYICPPAPLQYGLADALPMPPGYYTKMLADYTRKREMMCEALDQSGFQLHWPEGAYYAFASVAGLQQTRSGFGTARAACETLIQEAGVATVPGPSFFSEPAFGEDYLRFCFAKEFPVLEQACNQLVDAFA